MMCSTLEPVVFGLIFYTFNLSLNRDEYRLNLEDQMSTANRNGDFDAVHGIGFTNGNETMPVDIQHPQKNAFKVIYDLNSSCGNLHNFLILAFIVLCRLCLALHL